MTAAKIIAAGIISIFTTVALLPAFIYHAMGDQGDISTSTLVFAFYICVTALAVTAKTTILVFSRSLIVFGLAVISLPISIHFMMQRMLYLNYNESSILGFIMIYGEEPANIILALILKLISVVVVMILGIPAIFLGLSLRNV